jgi:hypothetical protein
MKRLVKRCGAPGVVLGIMALVVVAAGGAYAATSGGGTISVCVSKSGGGLYKARHCAAGERKLIWNVTGPKGAGGKTGSAGVAGGAGPAGPGGATGPAGPAGNNVTVTETTTVSVDTGAFGSAAVHCPSGDQALGGGVDVSNVLTMQVTSSGPLIGGVRTLNITDGQHGVANGWQGSADNNSGSTAPITVSVICAPIS